MDDIGFGSRVRAVRTRQRLRQLDVAIAAGVRVDTVVDVELGRLDHVSLGVIRRILAALGMSIALQPRWHGVELDRHMSGAHDALQGAVLESFERLAGWVTVAEATYAIFGERGAIDILAWHEATRTLLIIELKTVLVDAGELVRVSDQRYRLATTIAASRGWTPVSVARWLILTDTSTNRRRVRQHRAILRPLMDLGGRAMHTWLRRPSGPVSALSFWTAPDAIIRRRVRLTAAEQAALGAKAEAAAADAQQIAALARRAARHGTARGP